VTEQYATKLTNEGSPATVTSDFFSARPTATTITKVPLNDTTDAPNVKTSKKPLSRNRSTSRSASEKEEAKGKSRSRKSTTKTAAKAKPIAEKLLSPASALLRLNRQDLLFGTSSQLALQESPTLVRQIQQTMLKSEVDANVEDVAVWPRLQKVEGKRSLWAASARDDDGKTLSREAVYIPEPDRTQDFPLLMHGSIDEDDVPHAADALSSPKSAPAPILISSDLPTPSPTIVEQVAGATEYDAREEATFADWNDFPEEPPPSNQHVASGLLNDDFPTSAQLSPDSPLLHHPTIASTLTSLGSPKKKRGRPPKNQFAAPQVTASAPVPKKPPAQVKPSLTAVPATPKKKSQDRFAEVEEILDSEDDTALSPTPPRLRKLEDSPPLQFTTKSARPTAKDDLVPVFRVPEPHLQFAKVKSALFTRITSLVRSLPPSTSPGKPSWHEKILMYDPIVLEDFTAFLNMHSTIHTYRKATQKQVKMWNKHLKIKGEEKIEVEDSDGMVLATEKEAEIWMVRGWCEEMSVCCVVREGKGRGGVRKGLY
jgi:hypothetical protein